MPVLSDWEIKARCTGDNSNMVVPFELELLNPASLDVRLGDSIMVETIYQPEFARIDISLYTKDQPYWMQPGEFCLAETKEQNI